MSHTEAPPAARIHPHPYEPISDADPSCVTCGMHSDDDAWELVRHTTDTDALPPAPVSAEVAAARAEVELYRLKQAEAAYDVDMPSTLRERMAYARSLSASGLIPKAFRSGRGGDDGARETTANVLLAVELGNTLGLSPLQALCQINVVEGKPGLGAEGQLAQVLKAGHDLYVDDSSNREQATVVAQRAGQDRVHRITYTLEDAQAAGLCRVVDGKVVARSQQGKALPWETSTPDMLVWRAITRACKRVFPDVVGGLAVVEDEPGTQYPVQQSIIGQALTRGMERAAQAKPAGTTDSVDDDLALFTETTGPWWTHSGATVRRRNKLQLAADRLADALAAGDERVPSPVGADQAGIVDAELVDEPVHVDPSDPLLDPDLGSTVVDVAAEAAELERHLASVPDEPAHADPVEGEAQDLDPWSSDAVAAEQPAAGEVTGDAPLDRANLWAEVEALAAKRGKTVAQLLARHVLATRVNPEDMTAEQLGAFLSAQQGL